MTAQFVKVDARIASPTDWVRDIGEIVERVACIANATFAISDTPGVNRIDSGAHIVTVVYGQGKSGVVKVTCDWEPQFFYEGKEAIGMVISIHGGKVIGACIIVEVSAYRTGRWCDIWVVNISDDGEPSAQRLRAS